MSAAYGAGTQPSQEASEDDLRPLLWLLRRRSLELPGAPPPPTVEGATATELTVAWTAPGEASEIVGYDVQYRQGDESAYLPWDHHGTETRTTITGLGPETVYMVRVRAVNDFDAGDWSDPAWGTTAAPGPVFAEGDSARREIPENAAPGTPAGTPVTAVGATDYHLEGADAEVFVIDAASGQIRARDSVSYDYEERPEYAMRVIAVDASGHTARIAVTIAVLDLDEPPGAPPPPTVTRATSTSLTVRWTVPENAGPEISDYDVQYREFGGEFVDAGHEGTATTFRLGGLRRGTRYQIRVRATNAEGTGSWSERATGRTAGGGGGGGGGNTPATNTVPVFSGPSAFGVPENTSAVATIAANDPDGSDRITGYAIAGGVDAARFEIAMDGALRFADAPDFERPTDQHSLNPPSAAFDNEYLVSIEVTGGTGSRALTAQRELRVRVSDVQLEAPTALTVDTIASTSLTVRWTPSYNTGAVILHYELQRRAAGERDFALVDQRGLATVAGVPGLRPATSYEVQVRAVNADGPSPWSAATFATTAPNVAPAFVETDPMRQVSENTETGMPIGPPVTATDANDDRLAYALAGPDARRFAVHGDTGQLETAAPLDHEADEEHSVTLRVDDGQGGRTTVDVTISVSDLPEPPPVPAAAVSSSTLNSLTVRWTVPAHSGRPPISGYEVQYRASGPFEAWTHDDTTTSTTITRLDPSTDYDVQVLARNAEGASDWSIPATGRTEINQAPRFLETAPVRRVAENTDAGEDIGGPLTATDSDGGTLAYSLEGDAADRFDIVATTGQIRTRSGVDYDHETHDRHSVTVRVRDGQGGSATVGVSIRVTDVSGEAPDTPSRPLLTAASSTSLNVAWATPANTGPPIDDYDYRYRVDDPAEDWIEVINTSIVDIEVAIGDLHPGTGYEVQVRASNDEGTSDWSGSSYRSTGANADPTFPATSATRRIPENTPANRDIGAPVTATDEESTTLTYGLEGTDADSLSIVESTGQLRTVTRVDYNHEATDRYSVVVTAEDEHGGTGRISITVEIEDVEGEAPGIPDKPTVTATSPSRLDVSWIAPGNDGPAIEDYDYRHRPATSGATWTEVLDTTVSGTDTSIGDLMAATRYDVQIRATNDEGTGLWSPSGRGMTELGNPDLVVLSPAVDDSRPVGGASVTLSVTVDNQGTGPSDATTLRYYQSDDASISAADTELGTDSVGSLVVGARSDESVSVVVPSTDGTYYFGACTGTVARENLTDNNCSAAVAVVVANPDLVVENPTVSDDTVFTAESFTLSATVRNQGTRTSAATTLSYYRSSDASIGTGDAILGTDTVRGLAAAATAAESIDVTAPTSGGTYYYGACAASVHGEQATANNCSSGVAVTVTVLTVPKVTSVIFSSSPAAGQSGTYKLDDVIEVRATFSESVTVTGTPQVTLTIGAATRVAGYSSGSPGTELVFQYPVTTTDEDPDGASIQANGLDAGGGAVQKTGTTVDANLAHAARTNQSNHKVDGVAPDFASLKAVGDRIVLSFRESLDSSAKPVPEDFTVTVDGTTRDVIVVSVSGSTVTLTLDSAVTAEDAVAITYAGTGANPIRDAAQNTAPALAGRSVPNRTADVCSRTVKVRDAIVARTPVAACADVTADQLAEITFLDVSSESVSELATGDFVGLTALQTLFLHDNSLTSLPDGLLSGLGALELLWLHDNALTSLPANAFSGSKALRWIKLDDNELDSLDAALFQGLTALEDLNLSGNSLDTLPAGIFSELSSLTFLGLDDNDLDGTLPSTVFAGLTTLNWLWLKDNGFATLPTGLFSGLSRLSWLDLQGNDLDATLATDVFSGLMALQELWLADNAFAALPDGIFAGLTGLTELDLADNPADPLPLVVSLEAPAAGQLRAVVHTGAPFEITLSLRVRGGTIDGGATTLTIPQGSVESSTGGVSRIADGKAPVTVDLGPLPAPPGSDRGYVLTRSANLPLEVLAALPEVIVQPTTLTVREGGTNGYTLVLNSEPTATVTVDVTVSPSAAAGADPAELTFTVDDWHTPQTVTLTAATDADGDDDTATVQHRVGGGDYAGITAPGVTVTLAETVTDASAGPLFSSPSTFDVTENRTDVGTVAATDDDDEDEITGYALTGGADLDRFAISNAGTLRFVAVPDFERPTDAGTNNIYAVAVTATSGAGVRQRTATQAISVTVLDEAEPPATPPAPQVISDPNWWTSLQVLSGRQPLVNTGPAVSDFDIRYRRKGAGGFMDRSYTGANLDTRISSLARATTYEVQVRATNAEGTSDWSPSGEGTTPNSPPRIETDVALPDLLTAVGGATEVVNLGNAFDDPENDRLEFSVASSNSAVARVSVREDIVRVTPGNAGTATVTVTASDPYGASADRSFDVGVEAPALQRPTVSIDGNFLVFEFTDTFTANEIRAYEMRLRQKNPLGPWAVGCRTVTQSMAGAQSVTIEASLEDFLEPGTLYEADYGYLGTDCAGALAARSVTVERTADGTASFDVDVVFVGSVPSSRRANFAAAAERWAEIIEGDVPNFDYTGTATVGCYGVGSQATLDTVVDDLRIYARAVSIDGAGGAVADARICRSRPLSLLPTVALVRLDTADVNRLNNAAWEDVILHEMGHVLGIDGSLWRRHGLLRNPALGHGGVPIDPPPDTHFPGPLAIAAFNAAGGTGYSGAKVPVENGTGSYASRDSHWRRSVLGQELMATGIHTSGVNPLSAITIEALADLGYDVDPSQADAYVLPSNAPPHDASSGILMPLQCRPPEAQGVPSGGVVDAPILFRMRFEP